MRGRPGKSTRSNRANEPNAANRLDLRVGEEHVGEAEAPRAVTTAARTERLSARSPGSFVLNHLPMLVRVRESNDSDVSVPVVTLIERASLTRGSDRRVRICIPR